MNTTAATMSARFNKLELSGGGWIGRLAVFAMMHVPLQSNDSADRTLQKVEQLWRLEFWARKFKLARKQRAFWSRVRPCIGVFTSSHLAVAISGLIVDEQEFEWKTT